MLRFSAVSICSPFTHHVNGAQFLSPALAVICLVTRIHASG